MDPKRLGRLIERHAAALVLFARQRCATPEDVVQEAFIRLAGLRTPPENPLAWLFRAVRNGSINAATAANRRRRREAEAAAEAPAWFATGDLGAIGAEEAEAGLRALPVAQREVIVAHLWGGLSFEQIAEINACSSSTAHRHYHDGLNALRAHLGVPCPNKTSRPNPA